MAVLNHKKPKGKDEAFLRDLRALRARRRGKHRNVRRDPKIYVDKKLEG